MESLRILVALGLCGGILGIVGASESAPGSFAERCEQAVVLADLSRLEQLRSSLEPLVSNKGNVAPELRYDLAYVNWRIGHLLRDAPTKASKKKRKSLLKEAQAQLDLVLSREPDNAEAHALRGSVMGDRIAGMFSGISLGPKAGKALNLAYALEPDNPRVALQRGISWFFTPKRFGGGLEKAEQELRRAKALFEGEPATSAWPNWGRIDTLLWLGRVLAEADQTLEAEKQYREALALEPDYVWIRDELLPALTAN